MKTYAKIILFIISYVPLYFIFCIQQIKDKVFVWNEKEKVSEFIGIIKTIEIVREIQAGKKRKLDWMQWFIGGGIGLYAIEKMIGYLNKHH